MSRGSVWIGVWVACAFGLGGLLTLLHEGVLPAPSARAEPGSGAWELEHGLSMSCPCSRRIVEHLLTRGASPDAVERVIVAGASDELVMQLRARGFRVAAVSSAQLEAFGFAAVPGLVVRRPDGSVAYSGAHAPKRSGPIDDLGLVAGLRRGDVVAPFAVVGCAVSAALNARVDPLSLKSFFRSSP